MYTRYTHNPKCGYICIESNLFCYTMTQMFSLNSLQLRVLNIQRFKLKYVQITIKYHAKRTPSLLPVVYSKVDIATNANKFILF